MLLVCAFLDGFCFALAFVITGMLNSATLEALPFCLETREHPVLSSFWWFLGVNHLFPAQPRCYDLEVSRLGLLGQGGGSWHHRCLGLLGWVVHLQVFGDVCEGPGTSVRVTQGLTCLAMEGRREDTNTKTTFLGNMFPCTRQCFFEGTLFLTDSQMNFLKEGVLESWDVQELQRSECWLFKNVSSLRLKKNLNHDLFRRIQNPHTAFLPWLFDPFLSRLRGSKRESTPKTKGWPYHLKKKKCKLFCFI